MNGSQTVSVRAELKASVEKVWPLVGDFARMSAWAPAANLLSIQGAGVGALRTVRTVKGDFTERCDEVNEPLRRLRYSIVESPWPVRDYAAQVQLFGLGAQRCLIEWSGRFTPVDGGGSDFNDRLERMYLMFVREIQQALLRS